jgi:hypothetical protein
LRKACGRSYVGAIAQALSRSLGASEEDEALRLSYAVSLVLRASFGFSWLVPLAVLPGCLVSFKDYPLAEADGASSVTHGGRGGAEAPTTGGTDGAADAGGTTGASSPGGATAMGGAAAAGGSSAAGTANTEGGSNLTGGSSSAGSSSGGGDVGAAAGNASAGAPDMPLPNTNVIDDFEDGDPSILNNDGRGGDWYVGNDGGRGTQTPRAGTPLKPSLLDPARGASTRAAHTYGGPFQQYALIGTGFATDGKNVVAYDLTGYTGLRLWVRSDAQGSAAAKVVRLNIATPATDAGGSCSVCNDHFGADLALTSKWVQIEVAFASVKQAGWGRPQLAKADLSKAKRLEFLFVADVSFDLWVDDIELY